MFVESGIVSLSGSSGDHSLIFFLASQRQFDMSAKYIPRNQNVWVDALSHKTESSLE